jgi:hypothetical protein
LTQSFRPIAVGSIALFLVVPVFEKPRVCLRSNLRSEREHPRHASIV